MKDGQAEEEQQPFEKKTKRDFAFLTWGEGKKTEMRKREGGMGEGKKERGGGG